MAYILDINGDIKNPREYQALRKFFDAYKEYLLSLGERLPQSVRDFALADWYWDYNSHRCPYDGWVESLEICERASGERNQNRSIEIRLLLLAPYHDGHIEYVYRNVASYSFVMPAVNQRRRDTGHDGWKIDEVRLSESGNVVQEVLFKSGAKWSIECQTIEYAWTPV
jgi:hypothetical protein